MGAGHRGGGVEGARAAGDACGGSTGAAAIDVCHYGGMSWVKRLEERPGWRLKAKTLKVAALEQYVLWRIAVLRAQARKHSTSA